MDNAPQPKALSDFGDPSWFRDAAVSRMWLRFQSILCVAEKDAPTLFAEFPRHFDFDGPVKVGVGKVSDFKGWRYHIVAHAAEDGSTTFSTGLDQPDIPSALYMSFASPTIVDGGQAGEWQAKQRIAKAAGLIALCMGRNVLRDVVFDAEISADTGQPHVSSPVLEIPSPLHGPFLGKGVYAGTQEILTRLPLIPKDRRDRIFLALDFCEQAIAGKDRFLHYWTALEVLASGTSGAIRSKLQAIYHIRSHKEVDANLGFRTISQWRHNFLHKGLRPILSADVERYLQLMILELLRSLADLPAKRLLEAASNAPGWDLSPIGMRNNKSQSQG